MARGRRGEQPWVGGERGRRVDIAEIGTGWNNDLQSSDAGTNDVGRNQGVDLGIVGEDQVGVGDQCAGLVVERNGKLEPSFPNARHVIQQNEWETAINGKTSSYHKEIFEALNGKIDIKFVDGSGELQPGIRYEYSGGHCPFHQVFWIEENGQKCFFGGDELPEPEQLIRKFIAKYDYDGRKAMQLREDYGKIAAAEGWTCLFYHAKSITEGKVTYADEHFTVAQA